MKIRRLGALTMAGVLGISAVGAGTASANEQKTEIFNASAEATALKLNILGNNLLMTNMKANLDSTPKAFGAVNIVGLPGSPVPEVVALKGAASGAAEVVGADDTKRFPEVNTECQLATNLVTVTDPVTNTEVKVPGLEVIPGIARVHDATCPQALATIQNQLPSAQALGAQFKMDISISELLDAINLRDTLGGGEDDGVDDQIIDGLKPVVGAVTGLTPAEVDDLLDDTVVTLDDLLEGVLGLDTTIRLAIAPAVAEVSSTANSITAHAKAQALRIELLPLNDLGKYNGLLNDLNVGDPLLTIIVSEAEGSQTWNRDTQKLSPAEVSSAAVKIKIAQGLPLLDDQVLPLVEALFGLTGLSGVDLGAALENLPGWEGEADVNVSSHEIEIKGPGTFTVFGGTPLETTIVLSDVATNGGGGFSGSGVKVHTLKALQGGGVLVALSDITGGNAGDVKVLSELNRKDAPLELARTGGTPWIPLMGMVLLTLAVGSRRLLVSRNES